MPPRIRPQGPGGPETPSTFPAPSAHTPSGISGGAARCSPDALSVPLKPRSSRGPPRFFPDPSDILSPRCGRTGWNVTLPASSVRFYQILFLLHMHNLQHKMKKNLLYSISPLFPPRG